MRVQTFTMVHPEHGEAIGDDACFPEWEKLGWVKLDETSVAGTPVVIVATLATAEDSPAVAHAEPEKRKPGRPRKVAE